MEFPKLEEFLIGLQRSWEEAKKSGIYSCRYNTVFLYFNN